MKKWRSGGLLKPSAEASSILASWALLRRATRPFEPRTSTRLVVAVGGAARELVMMACRPEAVRRMTFVLS